MPTDSVAPLPGSALTGLLGPIIPGFFVVDGLALVLLGTLALIAILLILASPATYGFFSNVVLLVFFLTGAFGTITAANVVALIVAWEVCALAAWGIARRDAGADRVAASVVPLQAAGALGSFLVITGLALLAIARHDLGLGPSGERVPTVVPLALLVGLALKTYGVLAEIQTVHPWGHISLAGPTLAGAGVLVLGASPLLRLLGLTLADTTGWREIAFWSGTAFALVTVLAALVESDYRRILTNSAFSQFWLVVALLSSGPQASLAGAAISAIVAALAFSGLFLAISTVEGASTAVLGDRIGGLAQRLPFTAALFLVCTLALPGLPPFGGFTAADLGDAAGEMNAHAVTWIAVNALTFLSMIRLFDRLFLGELRLPVRAERRLPAVLASGAVVSALALLGSLASFLSLLLASGARTTAG